MTRSLVQSEAGGKGLSELGARSAIVLDRIDLSESISFFRRRLPLILAITVASLIVGFTLSFLSAKIYRAEAMVMLADKAPTGGQARATDSLSSMTGELVNTQLKIVTSRDMATRVAHSLHLIQGVNQSEAARLISDLQAHVSAKRSGDSFALEISYDGDGPLEATSRANEYARQFTNWEMGIDQERNAEARQRLEGKIAELRKQAQLDLEALQQYRIGNNLLSTSGSSLTEQEISNYNQEVARARAEASEDTARLQTAAAQLRSGSTGDDVGEALGSAVISSLRSQEAAVAAQTADLAARYGSNHPQLIRTKSQLAEIRGQIQAEIGRVVSNLRAKQEVSSQRLSSLTASLSNAKGMLSQNNSAMVGLTELERAADASKEIYETYLNSYKELLAAEGSEKPNARILTLAEEPLFPRSPNIILNAALSIVVGFGLGVLIAYLTESLFHGISTPEQIEREFGHPYLASIPLLESVDPSHTRAITAVQNPRSFFSESFRALATSIDQVTDPGPKVIAITSALPGEGKSVISCCLSNVLAADGLRTILIDCDLRRRGVSRLLNLPANQKGLLDILRGEAPLRLDHIAGDHVFCFIPLPPGDDDEPTQLLKGPEFVELLDTLRQKFDRIILDLPPVLPMSITRILASRADAVVVAAHWRKTSTHALRAALRRLPPDHVNVVGVALSQIDLRRRAFSNRHDPIFYHKKYEEYYQ